MNNRRRQKEEHVEENNEIREIMERGVLRLRMVGDRTNSNARTARAPMVCPCHRFSLFRGWRENTTGMPGCNSVRSVEPGVGAGGENVTQECRWR